MPIDSRQDFSIVKEQPRLILAFSKRVPEIQIAFREQKKAGLSALAKDESEAASPKLVVV